MKIVFAASQKRMIPYPPVGPAILAGALRDRGIDAQIIDLEFAVWNRRRDFCDMRRDLGEAPPYTLLGPTPASEAAAHYEDLIWELIDADDGEPIAVSVMGFEQLFTAFLLIRRALLEGHRVIVGGQFWSEKSACHTLEIVQSEQLTVTVGDGYEAIVQWHAHDDLPLNSYCWRDGAVETGAAKRALTRPPLPDYSSVAWSAYTPYASTVLGADDESLRAHLYVWDKQCPFKCNFCRVSTGSKAKLSAPSLLKESLGQLLDYGVRQFNFMTNELNPSLQYMRTLIGELRPLLEHRTDVAWFTYLRPDAMELSDLRDLRTLGCRLVRYGVETGSQRLSDLMQKDYHIETISRVLKDAARADLMNHVNFLVGYPGETDEDVDATIAFITENADVIHSVRINPFYLPPGSKLATDPEAYGIRLTTFKGGYWDFELLDGVRVGPEAVKCRIQRITSHLKDLGIGFSAVLPFETLDMLARYPDRPTAIQALREQRPYLWENPSPDWLKSRLGGYFMPAEWEATIYKRGQNYNMTLCND